MRGIRTYAIICAGILVAVFVALVLVVSFADLGLSGNGTAALFIGTLITVALTMVLMGLVFLSDRGGYDENANAAGSRKDPGGKPPSPR